MLHKEEVFLVNSANEWIQKVKDVPMPNMLFSEFWFEMSYVYSLQILMLVKPY